MGDRAIIVVKSDQEIAPCAVYLHWSGAAALDLVQTAIERMKGREGDVSYATARLIGICHEHVEGNLSLGVISAPSARNVLTGKLDDYSHGDAGVIVWDCGTNVVQAFAGYHAERMARVERLKLVQS